MNTQHSKSNGYFIVNLSITILAILVGPVPLRPYLRNATANMNWKSIKLTTSDDETHGDFWDESALRPLCIPGRFY